MGVAYYIVDKNKKQFYELGKGCWFDFDFVYLSDPELLSMELKKVFRLMDDDVEMLKYITQRLTPDLYKNFKDANVYDLKLINDCTDDLFIIRSKGYRCTGTRYYEIGSKLWIESMDFLNRHFKDRNKHLYDQKEASKYPEWMEY